MKLEALFEYLDGYLGVADHPDYPNALNGLEVEGPAEGSHVCAAVDVSEEVVGAAADAGADVLLVHHGLFWGGLRPLTGRFYRKVSRLVREGIALYGAHLPLDAHPEVGNCALLARAIGVEPRERFGTYEGAPIGWSGRWDGARADLVAAVEKAVNGPVRLVAGGPEQVARVGILTGGGGSFVGAAAQVGLDALVTGEGSHHTYVDATELGVNVLYAGHYATETFGVRALAKHVADRFDLTWSFLDFPSGL